MQRVAIDFMGPYKKTGKGNTVILVIVDYFTKWGEAFRPPGHDGGNHSTVPLLIVRHATWVPDVTALRPRQQLQERIVQGGDGDPGNQEDPDDTVPTTERWAVREPEQDLEGHTDQADFSTTKRLG
jgi:hypothetical protein